MPTYILLTKLTTEGRKTIRERPNRIQEVDREMEAMQVKVISQHAVVGPYDFVNIVEAPDNDVHKVVWPHDCMLGYDFDLHRLHLSIDFLNAIGSLSYCFPAFSG